MSPRQHLFIVAGEASGDYYAKDIVESIQSQSPDLLITGIGGHALKSTQINVIEDLVQYGLVGITNVLKHIFIIKKAFKAALTHLKNNPPSLVVLIDYPGFNLRLAKKIKKAHPKTIILFYISPQIWAWKKNRIHTIKKYVDHMAVILPFEKEIYQKENIPVTFVGHPLIQACVPTSNICPEDNTIAVLPGSRQSEWRYHMPILLSAMKILHTLYPKLTFVIPIASSLNAAHLTTQYQLNETYIEIIDGQARDVIQRSSLVIVGSGTASFETALLKKPMIIIYKASFLTYLIASCVIRVKYLGLSNILLNKEIAPELLQYELTVKNLIKTFHDILLSKEKKQEQIKHYTILREQLSAHESSSTLNIVQLISSLVAKLP
jgi:lipid-A-disaccharide synthase